MGPGYLVWYDTREEADVWAAVLEEARSVTARGPDPTAGTRSPEGQDREGSPRPSPIPFPRGSGLREGGLRRSLLLRCRAAGVALPG